MIAAAAVITLAAVVVIGNSPASEPRTALAGPRSGDPELSSSEATIASSSASIVRARGDSSLSS